MASGERIFNTSTYIQCRLAWTETEVSVANNTSRVWVSMSYRRTNSYGSTTYEDGYGFHVIIAGQWYKVGDSISIPGYDNSWHEIGSASRVMTHNDDGSLTIGVGCYHDGVLGLFNCNESMNATLDTIPRASVPKATPNPLTLSALSNPLTIATNRKSTSFTHDITCEIGTFTDTQTGVTDNCVFNIPQSVLADFPATSQTLPGTITCVTKNGSTTIGTKTAQFTAQINTAAEHPVIGAITITDLNPSSAAIEAAGSLIKNASNLRATIPLSVAGSYTQLDYAVVVCGNVSRRYSLSGTSGSITFDYDLIDVDSLTVYVTDKRGTTVTQTKSWTLIPYTNLTVTGTIDRTSETGVIVAFTLKGGCFAGSFGNATNQITVSYKWKLRTASTYTPGSVTFTFTPTGSGETSFEYSNTITGFEYDKQYDIIFTVEDLFTSAETRELNLTTGIPVWGNGSDFFAVYGDLFLHFDREVPSKFWNIKDGLDAILKYHANTNLLSDDAATATQNGVTFTVNADGTIRANGTATANTYFQVGTCKLTGGVTYALTGCPAGGDNGVYGLELMPISSVPMGAFFDYGEGYEFTEQSGMSYEASIVIWSGQTVDLLFEPMVRDVRIASDAYIPPAELVKTFEYEFYAKTLNTTNGNECQLTLPSDFRKSLGVVIHDAWPNQNWNNGAVVSICRDKTLEAGPADAGTTSYVYLTTTSGQSYQIKLVLIYLTK